MQTHNLFKPKSLEEGKHSVVGDCNGFSMQERWEKETPEFAKSILGYAKSTPGYTILDYGCGVGRLSKEIIKQDDKVTVIGLDASSNELEQAKEYVNDSRFIPVLPHELNQKVDLCYCVYVLQHVPAIEIREILSRIHHFLKPDGRFIYCSSDYRMAIRFDGQGFCDDRFLGVNLQEEINRFFKAESGLFNSFPNEVVEKMITGGSDGLAHPAFVLKKRKLDSRFTLVNAFVNEDNTEKDTEQTCDVSFSESGTSIIEDKVDGKKVTLRNRQSPGDILVMSVALRALKQAHPEYEIDVDTPCNDIFENNPYATRLDGSISSPYMNDVSKDAQIIDMQYPEIHKSGQSGRHFVDGHRKYLEEILEIKIPRVGLLPDIFLTQDEKNWSSPVEKYHENVENYICLNGGSKGDYTLKQYHRWQEVADLWNELHPEITLVQIGLLDHNHKPLNGTLDLRGKTNGLRELFRTIHHSLGVFTCVSFPMHIAAAMQKPCVVVAGGREGTRWELYPNHRFLYVNGAMTCSRFDGCWKSKLEECEQPVDTDIGKAPLCLELIRPQDVVRAMELYIEGGVIKTEEKIHANS